jgi:hypothetical protein
VRTSEGGERRTWSGVLNAVVSMVGHLGQAWRDAPARALIAAGNAPVQDPAPALDPPRCADVLASGLVTSGVCASVIGTEAGDASHRYTAPPTAGRRHRGKVVARRSVSNGEPASLRHLERARVLTQR